MAMTKLIMPSKKPAGVKRAILEEYVACDEALTGLP
jgi:hypothetical protein